MMTPSRAAKWVLMAGVLGMTILASAQGKVHSAAANLIAAVRSGRANEVGLLIRRGADPNVRDKQGMTPLHYAAYRGDAACAKALLKGGADPNAKDSIGMTPLHDAAYAGHAGFVKVLLNGGAAVSPRDKWGNTPLHYAVYKKSVVAVRVLLEAGADRSAANDKGATPADMAAASGSSKIAGMFASGGPKAGPKVFTNETLKRMPNDGHFVIQKNKPIASGPSFPGHLGNVGQELGRPRKHLSTAERIKDLSEQIDRLKKAEERLESEIPQLEKKCDEFNRLESGEQVGLSRRSPPPDWRHHAEQRRYEKAIENDRDSSCGALERAKQEMGKIAVEISGKKARLRLLEERAWSEKRTP